MRMVTGGCRAIAETLHRGGKFTLREPRCRAGRPGAPVQPPAKARSARRFLAYHHGSFPPSLVRAVAVPASDVVNTSEPRGDAARCKRRVMMSPDPGGSPGLTHCVAHSGALRRSLRK